LVVFVPLKTLAPKLKSVPAAGDFFAILSFLKHYEQRGLCIRVPDSVYHPPGRPDWAPWEGKELGRGFPGLEALELLDFLFAGGPFRSPLTDCEKGIVG
jgi:hypothetical protein